MRVWQIAAGRPGRFYDDLFIEQGIMILGPGHKGDALINKYSRGQVASFARKVQPGDRILLRKRKDVVAIGEIPNNAAYSFVENFKCIYGWNLCHSWQVGWTTDKTHLNPISNIFSNLTGAKESFSEIHNTTALAHIASLPQSTFPKSTFRSDQLILNQPLSDDDLRIALFKHGMGSVYIEHLIQALRQIRQIGSWYDTDGAINGRPTEHEVVAHIILPLLLSLGWSQQQIAVEWNMVDLALFLKMPTVPNNCIAVVEAKGINQDLGKILDQPQGYVTKHKLTNAMSIIVTDGLNIFLYKRKRTGSAEYILCGYLNVMHLSDKNIVPFGTSAIDTLINLQPTRIGEPL